MKPVKQNLLMEQFNFLSIDQCDGLIDWFQHQKKAGKTINQKTKVIPDYVAPYTHDRYNTETELAQLEDAYLPRDDILCKEQFELVNNYAAKYGKQIKTMHGLIVTSYPIGGFIQWHVDRDGDSLFSTAMHLNTDFEGGELQFGIDANGKKQIKNITEGINYYEEVQAKGEIFIETIKPYHTADKKAGQGMIYSSDSWHRVKEVTAGTRYSLLGWFHGGDI